jgi:Holliday junction resolvasome RuvABC endonuclease subunit
MTAPRVLALDLSLAATGVAYPDGELDTFRPGCDGDERLTVLRDDIREALYLGWGVTNFEPDLVVIEDFVVRSGASSVLGMLHGAIRVLLMDEGLPYLTVPPATLKVYATGGGRAQKPDMRMELYKRTQSDVADDNQVDAAWLRLLALDLAGHPEITLPQTHRRALTKLTWPETVPA